MNSLLLRFKQHPVFLISSLALLGIFLLGVGLRLYDLTDPPIDFHPTRQLRNAIVARSIYYQLLPDADETTRQQAEAFGRSTGQYEPPILESIVAFTYLVVGQERLWISRLYTTLFWMIGGVALFALSKRIAESTRDPHAAENNAAAHIPLISAAIALAYYLVLPFSVQASRSFQPDPFMVMWLILAVFALYRWSEDRSWKWALLAGVFGGMGILVKPVAAYILAGAGVALVLQRFVRKEHVLSGLWDILKNPQIWLMVILMLAPTLVYNMGRGQRASEYFSNWTLALSHLLLEPWLYLRWANTVQKLLGPVPLILSLVGIIIARARDRALLTGLWAGYFIYGLTLPYQMYTHSYYHLQLTPIVALSMVPLFQSALSWVSNIISNRARSQQALILGLTLGLATAVLVYTSWIALIPQTSKDYHNEPAHWEEIAAFLPRDGKIMALTQDYGFRLMYYGWRKVTLWPNRGEQQLIELRGSGKSFEELFAERAEGKRYFLITSFRQFDDQPVLKQTLYDHYVILAEGNGYIIFDLAQKKTP